jgi:putative N6-adenine-specific DNA methylase
MSKYTIIAASTFGLESVLAYELRLLGYSDLVTENGRVSFNGDEKDIARCNIGLRVADRVLIEVAKFRATDFEELFQRTLKIKWEDFIPLKGKMHVVGKSTKSRLFSVRDCQSIVKKAIIEAMKRRYRDNSFEESGPVYKIEIALLNDTATLTIDTTGHGLHKRGYREGSGDAPLRETLAAGLVMLSRWNQAIVLADPFCGSGTIPIEAAMIGKNIAPGLKRTFASEEWDQIPKRVWDEERRNASARVKNPDFRILASDIDGYVLKKARVNAQNAGVADCISFQKLTVKDFRSSGKHGYLICNPPYGERTGNEKEVEEIYRAMGEAFQRLDSWSFFILTAHTGFERFFGKKADNNRKLYNGNIKCYYYQYHAKKI